MGITPASECIKPVTDWARGGAGTAIGGRILDGCDWPAEWKNRYVFGDHEQGELWSIQVNATRDGVMGEPAAFANTSGITAIKMGTDNALYLVEHGAGRVARVTLKDGMSMPNSCPTVDAPGGNPGGGGAGGSGTAGTAGSPSGGNSNNPGGGNASGGSAQAGSPTTGGAANNPSAGSPGNPAAGTNGTAGGGTTDEGGCGCRAVGSQAGSLFGFSLLAGVLGLALERRRRSRRS
jgi:hypothetical protein